MAYEVCFEGVKRGHHVYKQVWKPEIGEKLLCMPDNRVEVRFQDLNSIGIFKVEKTDNGEKEYELV